VSQRQTYVLEFVSGRLSEKIGCHGAGASAPALVGIEKCVAAPGAPVGGGSIGRMNSKIVRCSPCEVAQLLAVGGHRGHAAYQAAVAHLRAVGGHRAIVSRYSSIDSAIVSRYKQY
jgi:hypothetical protein